MSWLSLVAVLAIPVAIVTAFDCAHRYLKARVVDAFGRGIQVGRSLARFTPEQVNAIMEGTGVPRLERKDTDL